MDQKYLTGVQSRDKVIVPLCCTCNSVQFD